MSVADKITHIFICRFLSNGKKSQIHTYIALACGSCLHVDFSSKENNMQVATEFEILATHGKKLLATSVPQHLQLYNFSHLRRTNCTGVEKHDIHKIEHTQNRTLSANTETDFS